VNCELTEFIVNLHKSRKARKEGRQSNVSLSIGTLIGKLTVKDLKFSDVDSFVTYDCECECGGTVELTYAEVKDRAEKGKGCLGPMCEIAKEEDLVFTDMDECLKDQFRRMIVYHSNRVCEEWGGSGSDLDLGSAYENFYFYVMELGATKDNGYWMPYRLMAKYPFEPGNVDIGIKDKMKGKRGEKLFIYEDNLISIEEASEIMGCEPQEILTLQEAMIADEDIYESFI